MKTTESLETQPRCLEPQHLADLRRSGLSDETIERSGIYSCSAEEGTGIVGFPLKTSCLAFPYQDTDGDGTPPYIRIKPDTPHVISGKPAKYLTPKGAGNRLYIPPGVEANLRDPSRPLLITEGEKKALKATQEGLDCVGLSGVWSWRGNLGNGKSGPIPDLDRVEWHGREVVILFDTDSPEKPEVRIAEKALALHLKRKGAMVKVIHLPGKPGVKVGPDDFLVSNPVSALLDLIQEEPTAKENPFISQSEKLIKLAAKWHLFHDQHEKAHVILDDEVVPLNSKKVKSRMAYEYFRKEGKAPNHEALNQALSVLEGQALFQCPKQILQLRIAKTNKFFWVDLGDKRAVKMSHEGWEIAKAPPIFRKYQHQKPMPDPVHGGDPWRIFEYLNVPEGQKLLFLVCISSYLVPDIPHPIFHPHGPQGSGKTTMFKIIKRLIDPSRIEVFIAPRDPMELIRALAHHHLLLIDNLGSLPYWAPDILSPACTGGGVIKRKLFTDDEDFVIEVNSCIGLNGINQLITKPDLMDRSILLYQDPIDPVQRKEESVLWDLFEKARPEISGGLFDALSNAMAIFPGVSLERLPRMADFARWGYAIAQALGKKGTDFLLAYQNNITGHIEEVVRNSLLAQAVLSLMEGREEPWEDTVMSTWEKLREYAEPSKADRLFFKNDKTFPGSYRGLKNSLERIKPTLQTYGIEYEFPGRMADGFHIIFRKAPETTSGCSASSQTTKEGPPYVPQDISTEERSAVPEDVPPQEGSINEHHELDEHLSPTWREKPSGDHKNGESPQEQFNVLFETAIHGIEEHYHEGTREHIHEHHPDLERRIDEAEERVQNTLREGLQGKSTLEEFGAVLREWVRLEREAIRLFSEAGKSENQSKEEVVR